MVNERYDERYDGQEESEYHFSDDQVNYEMETDASARDAAANVVVSKESMADKIKNHRRIVVGIVVFIVLLGIVYKLIVPSTTVPATDFSQQTTSKVPAKPAPVVHQQAPAPVQAITAPVVAAVAQPQQPAAIATAPQIPPAAAVTVTTTTQSAQPAIPTAPASPAVAIMPENIGAMNKGELDRIATLEQQNSAIMNLLQTQYVQRLAEAEAQNTLLRNQVQELTGRVSSMEVAFRQLTKILSGTRSSVSNQMPGMSAPQPARVIQPKLNYTVQAIIPGRAWLKSESGDTVTVAEGDVLKDLGRITKIDPYDGIVDIDTGSKVISLSYGATGD
jgi:hypothetical protein